MLHWPINIKHHDIRNYTLLHWTLNINNKESFLETVLLTSHELCENPIGRPQKKVRSPPPVTGKAAPRKQIQHDVVSLHALACFLKNLLLYKNALGDRPTDHKSVQTKILRGIVPFFLKGDCTQDTKGDCHPGKVNPFRSTERGRNLLPIPPPIAHPSTSHPPNIHRKRVPPGPVPRYIYI